MNSARQIANDGGRADKVVALDPAAGTVLYHETNGVLTDAEGRAVAEMTVEWHVRLAAADLSRR